MADHGWRPDGEDREILARLAAGETVEVIARNIRMSERTVRRRLHAMAEQLGVGTTMQVVVYAVRSGAI